MRELKFRAWNNETKGMIPDVQNELLIGAVSSISDLFLMQYTGLKDKNGLEIYEGDIVQELEDSYYAIENDEDRQVNGTYVIEYEGNGFWPKDRDENEYGFFETESNFRVIGNIYQNPELLK